jgi:uncharacterized protein YndB with AHSA1/START domain
MINTRKGFIMSTTQITAEPGGQEIVITREFDAPPELLFRVHTDPDLLSQWMGPRRLSMEVDIYDVRAGGQWRFIHRDTDGTGYGFRGVFHNTPSVDGIVRTFEFEGAPGHVSLETLTFEDLRNGRTLVRASAVFQSAEARDAMVASGMESGVDEGYERLDDLLASLAPTR